MNNSLHTKRISFSAGVGSSSIMIIFVILCLFSFATLSIVSANAEYKLSSKVLERTTAYYEASNQMEYSLAQLDRILALVYEESESAADFYRIAGYAESFSAPISESQSLEVTVAIQYPEDTDDTFYRILSWKVENTNDIEIEEETLNLIK